MLLRLLVLVNLLDLFTLSIALSLLHLLFAKLDDTLLLTVPHFDSLLELSDELVDLTLCVAPDFLILAETTYLLIVVKSFTAALEEILSVVNVSFFELLVGLFGLSVILLVLIFLLLAFQL